MDTVYVVVLPNNQIMGVYKHRLSAQAYADQLTTAAYERDGEYATVQSWSVDDE